MKVEVEELESLLGPEDSEVKGREKEKERRSNFHFFSGKLLPELPSSWIPSPGLPTTSRFFPSPAQLSLLFLSQGVFSLNRGHVESWPRVAAMAHPEKQPGKGPENL